MVEAVGLFVRRDVRVHQPGFFPVRLHVGFFQADLPGADGLDLAALQGDAGLEGFDQEIFEFGLAIGRNDFDVFHMAILPQIHHPHFEIASPEENVTGHTKPGGSLLRFPKTKALARGLCMEI